MRSHQVVQDGYRLNIFEPDFKSATDERVRQERAYGLHSGIPKCCVEFFCWSLRDERAYHQRWDFVKAIWDNPEIKYVLCPDCYQKYLRREDVLKELHICSEDCIPVLRNLGATWAAERLERQRAIRYVNSTSDREERQRRKKVLHSIMYGRRL